MAQSPIIKDSTGQAIVTALQALSAPSGTDVAISPTGMHIVTEDDVQGAISELDTAVDSVNASLTQLGNDIVSYDVYDILSEVRAIYTAIGSSSRIVMYRLGGNVRMIDFNIVASGAISSGKVTLTDYIASKNLVHGSIATSSGTSGFVQYDGNKDLFIRVPSAGTYNGQLVFIAP